MKRSCTTSNGKSGASGSVLDALTTSYSSISNGTWVRPADWLPLPVPAQTEEKLVALYAVYPQGGNYAAFTSAVAYTVNWGDGTVENFAAGVQANHKYDYNNVALVGSECSLGYRQAKITITPQVGGFTTVSLNVRHPALSVWTLVPIVELYFQSLTATILTLVPVGSLVGLGEVECAGIYAPNATVATAFNAFGMLSKITHLTVKAGSSRANYFFNCISLIELPVMDLASVTSAANMFGNCRSLRNPPQFVNTQSLTDVTSMFVGCNCLRAPPVLNTSKVTNFSSVFSGCYSLATPPLFDMSAAVLCTSMFNGCTGLVEFPAYSTPALKNTSQMFQNCQSLRKPPTLNTALVTDMSNMFSGCYSLDTYPTWLNYSAVTTVAGMFNQCLSLLAVPNLVMPKAINLSSFFSGCTSLKYIGDLQTSPALTTLTQALYACSSLLRAPVISDTTKVTTVSQMLQLCSQIRTIPTYQLPLCINFSSFLTASGLVEVPPMDFSTASSAVNLSALMPTAGFLISVLATGLKYSFSVANSRMDDAALNLMFTNLPVVVGQTVTITGCPGAAAGTAIDRSIATAKGWTVAG